MPDPSDVWRLIMRADDIVKYAGNRDVAAAYAQARTVLDRAEEAAASLADRVATRALLEQIRRRRGDLDRTEGAGG